MQLGKKIKQLKPYLEAAHIELFFLHYQVADNASSTFQWSKTGDPFLSTLQSQ